MDNRTTTLPDWATGSAVRDRFDRIAFGYDFWGKITESDALKRALEFAKLRNGMRVLELASGTGRFFRWIVQTNPDGFNVGIEISGKMIKTALEKLTESPEQHWKIIQGDIRALPLQKQYWDRIVCNFLFDLLSPDEIQSVLRSIVPLLRPEGKLVISTMGFGDRWYHKAWSGIANRWPQLLTYCHPIAIASDLKKVGFEVERQEFVSQNTFPSEVTAAVPIESGQLDQHSPMTSQEEYYA